MRVIKLGGRAQNDPRLPGLIGARRDRDGGRLCVVHGGGDEISALQTALGRKPKFIDGRRVTTVDDLQLLRMVLSGVINKRLVNAFVRAGVQSLGLSGEDGKLISAGRGADVSLGSVGIPASVNAELLETLISAGYMPVISPVGYDPENAETGALNVNGDDAAAAIAAALGADELLFVADVEGVMSQDGSLIKAIDSPDIGRLVVDGTARGGMAAKLDAARTALNSGVEHVRISDLEGIMDESRGTTVNSSSGVAG
jgi:acetylglutamate kinase